MRLVRPRRRAGSPGVWRRNGAEEGRRCCPGEDESGAVGRVPVDEWVQWVECEGWAVHGAVCQGDEGEWEQ